jgi:type VI secretion system Hcp family effector
MAQESYLELTAAGQPIEGESDVESGGRENKIPVLSWQLAGRTATEGGRAASTGRRQYDNVVMRMRLDKTMPLLSKAFRQNEIMEGTLRCYRPSPDGSGVTEQFFTFGFSEGRIVGLRIFQPDTLDPATSNEPITVEVQFRAHTLRFTHETASVEDVDDWRTEA